MPKKLTTETFIKRAIDSHGTKYDYSKVVYVRSSDKIIIVCLDHGDFEQRPNNHLSGIGCDQCGGSATLNTETFIERAIEIHGKSTYDYSKVQYVGNKKKVIIVCQEHGEFPQIPSDHLTGKGCSHCAGNVQLTTEGFIKRANEVHIEGTYNYSKVNYSRTHDNVIIVCQDHGEFPQSPASHLSGQGCPHCGGSAPLNTETFIQKAIEKHGVGIYDYSKVEYVRNKDKLIIMCPEHGEFEQTPGDHLSGRGCAGCADYGFNTTNPAIMYVLKFKNGIDYKIGITNRTVKDRFSNADLELFDVVRELKFDKGQYAIDLEQYILRTIPNTHPKELLESGGNTEIRQVDLSKVLDDITSC